MFESSELFDWSVGKSNNEAFNFHRIEKEAIRLEGSSFEIESPSRVSDHVIFIHLDQTS